MAKWSEKLNQMTQSAISKSKEVAGVAKLNMDNTSLNLDIKNIQTQIGAYVLENKLLAEDASIKEWVAKVETIKAKIENNNEKIRELKNVNVCPDCGAEVDRNSRFCNKCGAEIAIPASASEVETMDSMSESVEEVGEAEAAVTEAETGEAEAEATAQEAEAEEAEAEAAAQEAEIGEVEAEAVAQEAEPAEEVKEAE